MPTTSLFNNELESQSHSVSREKWSVMGKEEIRFPLTYIIMHAEHPKTHTCSIKINKQISQVSHIKNNCMC